MTKVSFCQLCLWLELLIERSVGSDYKNSSIWYNEFSLYSVFWAYKTRGIFFTLSVFPTQSWLKPCAKSWQWLKPLCASRCTEQVKRMCVVWHSSIVWLLCSLTSSIFAQLHHTLQLKYLLVLLMDNLNSSKILRSIFDVHLRKSSASNFRDASFLFRLSSDVASWLPRLS